MKSDEHVEFQAQEYLRDTSLRAAQYAIDGNTGSGWRIHRDGAPYLELGPGYRLLRTQHCGVCSTDLDRHHLPFPLPQVTGHEIVAHDADGIRYVVEINASHAARGVDADCPFCRQGLAMHCPERLVLGINTLPGGFGPWVLAPVEAVVALPDSIPSSSAVLVEPFAAALKAVTTIDVHRGDTIAVLGPRRLGMLIVAALAGHRRAHGLDYRILALARRQSLLELANRFGADEGRLVDGDGHALPSRLADIVIDATGSPPALELATRLASRELHVKSTHGQPAAGVARLTQMVVDELALDRLPPSVTEAEAAVARLRRRCQRTPLVCWLAATTPPAWLRDAATVLRSDDALEALAQAERLAGSAELPRADVAVVDSPEKLSAVIRPDPDTHRSLVRPGGEIWLPAASDAGAREGSIPDAVATRGLRVSSSRCGDFRSTVAMLERDAELSGRISELITHRFDADQLEQALAAARSPDGIKVVITHPEDRT